MSMEASHHGPMRAVISSWWLSMLVGVTLIGLGLASLLGLGVFTTVLAMFVGVVLVIMSVLLAILALSSDAATMSRVVNGLIALVALIAGVYLLLNPGVGLSVTTLVLAVFFPLEGFAKAWLALGMRDTPKWWMMLASGIVSIGLGILIWVEGLSIAAGNIGLFLGIDLIVLGTALVVMAISTRG